MYSCGECGKSGLGVMSDPRTELNVETSEVSICQAAIVDVKEAS